MKKKQKKNSIAHGVKIKEGKRQVILIIGAGERKKKLLLYIVVPGFAISLLTQLEI